MNKEDLIRRLTELTHQTEGEHRTAGVWLETLAAAYELGVEQDLAAAFFPLIRQWNERLLAGLKAERPAE
jgi:hypothetical protein